MFARIVTGKSFVGLPDKERYLTMDHLSSLGLLILGCMAVAEAFGMAVQSILTVGRIGGSTNHQKRFVVFLSNDFFLDLCCPHGINYITHH